MRERKSGKEVKRTGAGNGQRGRKKGEKRGRERKKGW